jgi:hypothetical protein
MVLETKAGLEAGMVGSGHRFAGARLGAQRSQAGWVSEAMGGLSYLEYIRGLAKRVESDWEGVQVGAAGRVGGWGGSAPVFTAPGFGPAVFFWLEGSSSLVVSPGRQVSGRGARPCLLHNGTADPLPEI